MFVLSTKDIVSPRRSRNDWPVRYYAEKKTHHRDPHSCQDKTGEIGRKTLGDVSEQSRHLRESTRIPDVRRKIVPFQCTENIYASLRLTREKSKARSNRYSNHREPGQSGKNQSNYYPQQDSHLLSIQITLCLTSSHSLVARQKLTGALARRQLVCHGHA